MDQPPKLQHGLRRIGLVLLGLFFVGMAFIGILLPGVPATPFLLLASYCFVRSSPRLYRWLHRSPLFGALLRDWETHRGMRRGVKRSAMAFVVIAVSCSITFSSLPVWAKISIGCLALVGLTVISRIPTIPDSEVRPPLPGQSDVDRAPKNTPDSRIG